MLRIGIQGVAGSFNEAAAHAFFPNVDIQLVYLVVSEKVCQALIQEEIDFGVVGFENSIGGCVQETKEALEKYQPTIVKQCVLPISQTLITKKSMDFRNITEVHSHPQALKQSQRFLTEQLPQAKQVVAADTAICAQQLKEGLLCDTIAVIGSQACVDLYGLYCLKENIQDTDDNRTTFLLLQNRAMG